MSLLPPNASPLERRIAGSASDLPVGIVPTLWNPDTCPASLLHVLAWAESVDQWDASWSEGQKREAIKRSRDIHRQKGTPAAIKRMLGILGHEDAVLVERSDLWRHDGSRFRNGLFEHGGECSWARYKVFLKRPITIDQAKGFVAMIKTVSRNCCHLAELNFSEVALRHNGAVTHDGRYTRGAISNRSYS